MSEYAASARGRFFQIRPDGMVRAISEADFNKAMEQPMGEDSARQLPRYQCHKHVCALKIEYIQPVVGGSAIITPVELGYLPFEVSREYIEKHKPQVGGYWVKYDQDNYESYSPAKAFENGYTKL